MLKNYHNSGTRTFIRILFVLHSNTAPFNNPFQIKMTLSIAENDFSKVMIEIIPNKYRT